MNAGTYFAAVERLPFGRLEAITQAQPFLIVAPHPDDETLGCSGLMAAACAAGVPFRIVVVTDGCASHPRSRRFPPARLRDLRRAESLAAAAACGVPPERLIFLDLPDAGLPGDAAMAARAVDAIAAAAEEVGARSAFVTWRLDPHGDHLAAHDFTATAARRLGVRLWSYPIWGWRLPPEAAVALPPPRGFRLDIAPWLDLKRRAVACHASQTTRLVADDPEGFILLPEVLERFLGPVEFFLREDA